jgi:creatinine amidohydrolase/Fe(II)-dependent formamide hydrolase-like protein
MTCWRDEESERDGLGLMIDHAAAKETSITMALHPDLVFMEYLAADPVGPVAVAGLDPRTNAGPELGNRILSMQGDRMAGVLRGLLGKR